MKKPEDHGQWDELDELGGLDEDLEEWEYKQRDSGPRQHRPQRRYDRPEREEREE